MSKIIHKMQFSLEDDVCRELADFVPLGKRNQVANEALRKELAIIRHRQANKPVLSAALAEK